MNGQQLQTDALQNVADLFQLLLPRLPLVGLEGQALLTELRANIARLRAQPPAQEE